MLEVKKVCPYFFYNDITSSPFIVHLALPTQNKNRKIGCVRFTEMFVKEKDAVLYPSKVDEPISSN